LDGYVRVSHLFLICQQFTARGKMALFPYVCGFTLAVGWHAIGVGGFAK